MHRESPAARIVTLAVVLLGLVAIMLGLAALTTPARAQLPYPTYTLAKDVTYPGMGQGVSVGEAFTVTLTFENEWTMSRNVEVRDRNPAPQYLEILEDTLTGGAQYEPQSDAVVWSGSLGVNGPTLVTFQMRAIGGASRRLTNYAYLDDPLTVETLPDAQVWASIYIKPDAPVLYPINNIDGDGTYLVDWSDVTAAITYTLEEDDNAGFTSPITRFVTSTSQYQVSGRGPGTWFYRVRASNLWVDSVWSNRESVAVILDTPQLLSIDNPDRDGEYLVEWLAVTGATTYTLEEDDNPDFSTPITRYAGPGLQQAISGQDNGIWYYRVQASTEEAESLWSSSRTVVVGPIGLKLVYLPLMVRNWPPIAGAPVLQAISNPDGDGTYSVKWSTASNAQTFALAEATNSEFIDAIEVYSGPALSYTATGHGASRYFYRVKGRSGLGDSDWSNVQWVDVLWEAEPNDSVILANGPLVSGLTYFGTFPFGDGENDYFFIDMPTAGKIDISLQKIPAGHNYDLVLRDNSPGWPLVGYSGENSNSDEYISTNTLPKGRYYIQVFNRWGTSSNQPYELTVVY